MQPKKRPQAVTGFYMLPESTLYFAHLLKLQIRSDVVTTLPEEDSQAPSRVECIINPSKQVHKTPGTNSTKKKQSKLIFPLGKTRSLAKDGKHAGSRKELSSLMQNSVASQLNLSSFLFHIHLECKEGLGLGLYPMINVSS